MYVQLGVACDYRVAAGLLYRSQLSRTYYRVAGLPLLLLLPPPPPEFDTPPRLVALDKVATCFNNSLYFP